MQWIVTLFSYDLPIEIATRIIDLFLIDGWKTIFKTILSLLFLVKDNLRNLNGEELIIFLKTFTCKTQLDGVHSLSNLIG